MFRARSVCAVAVGISLLICLSHPDAGNKLYPPLDAKYKDSIWLCNCTDGSVGTAFFVSPTKAVTAGHVVSGKGVGYTLTQGKKSLVVVKVDTWSSHDIAILEVVEKQKDFLNVSLDTPFWGQRITIIGHPMGLPVLSTEGTVGSYDEKFGSYWKKAFYLSCQSYPGNSGSPVIDMNTGKVIGVMVGATPNYTQMSVMEPISKVKNAIK